MDVRHLGAEESSTPLRLASKRKCPRRQPRDLGSLPWKRGLSCFLRSSVRHITTLVGLESNVTTQSWQLCSWILGLEPSCQPCAHRCPRHCLALFKLIEPQRLENSRSRLGSTHSLQVFSFLLELSSSRKWQTCYGFCAFLICLYVIRSVVDLQGDLVGRSPSSR